MMGGGHSSGSTGARLLFFKMVVAMSFDYDLGTGSVENFNAVCRCHADTDPGDGNSGLLTEGRDPLPLAGGGTEKQLVVFAPAQGMSHAGFSSQCAKRARKRKCVLSDVRTDTAGLANMAQVLNQSVADIDHRRGQISLRQQRAGGEPRSWPVMALK